MKKQYSSKQRKIHKLKRDNVILGQWRSQLLLKGLNNSRLICCPNDEVSLNNCLDYLDVLRISSLSFLIGKNSAKIQRLRTLIQQEKTYELK